MPGKIDIAALRRSGAITAAVLQTLTKMVAPGVNGKTLEARALELFRQLKGEPAFLGYHGFPAAVCISLNDAIVHGVPGEIPFEPGDLVSIDAGTRYNGWYSDAAVTVGIPPLSPEKKKLLNVGQHALSAGIAALKPGARLGDVEFAMQEIIEVSGFGNVTALCGHGVGRKLQEKPQILTEGKPGTGPIIKPGMVLALEPMVTLGQPAVRVRSDQWTVESADNSPAAHFEHTVLVTSTGHEILTK